MKAKVMILLLGVGALTMIFLTGYQPVAAAPPAGEVKSMAPDFGTEVPLPHIVLLMDLNG